MNCAHSFYHRQLRCAIFSALLSGVLPVFGAPTAGAEYSKAQVDEALRQGVRFLVETQAASPEGGIHSKSRNETAMTALAIMAMAAQGHLPSHPSPEGGAMRKALDFVLQPERQTDDGYFGREDGSRMYGHGIVTLMLAEMSGMGADEKQDGKIRVALRKGVDLILRAQKVPKAQGHKGGWRYTPDSGESDMSVTCWQTMALRAAKNAGMEVPKEAIDEAVAYIKGLYEEVPKETDRNAGFGYSRRGRDLSTTAEGLLALQTCGEYEGREVLGAAQRLLKSGFRNEERWLFYTAYYYAQGMYQRGGKHAQDARREVASLLLPLQARTGAWEGKHSEERSAGEVYATSLAILSLSVKNHYLPIYQR